jgi:hypothetical protein
MTVEPTYQIDWVEMERKHPEGLSRSELYGRIAKAELQLQAIADAWNRPWRWGTLHPDKVRDNWPKLGALLDALTQDDNDDN